MTQQDPLLKLRPMPATPADEICSCVPPRTWKLMYALVPNPLHCTGCNLELPLDELDLDIDLVDAIAHWRSVHGSIYKLWLDSGPYEAWARKQLADLGSPTNTGGRLLTKDLNERNPCYYSVFDEADSNDRQPRTACPLCEGALESHAPGKFPHVICETCALILWDENAEGDCATEQD